MEAQEDERTSQASMDLLIKVLIRKSKKVEKQKINYGLSLLLSG
jgi:hypothetical protein